MVVTAGTAKKAGISSSAMDIQSLWSR